MALIGKIREKSWLLVIVVGVAMLAFVIGDFGFGNGGPQEDIYGIGSIDGEKVDENRYENFLNNARNNIFQSKQEQSYGAPVEFTQQDEENAKSQAWRTIIISALMEKEYKKIGLIVDEFEIENILYGDNGYTPSSFATQFTDSITGEFAPEQLRLALNQLLDSNDPQAQMQYDNIIDYIRQVRLEEKYRILLETGVHTTTVEAKNEYNAKKTVKNVSYVFQSLNDVPVDAISDPSEEEMKAYFAKHKHEKVYKQVPGYKIAYFSIPIQPSHNDTANAEEYLKNLAEKFAKTSKDSLFIMRYSDVKRYANDSTSIARPDGSDMPTGYSYPLSIAAELEAAEKGDVVGPYVDKEGIKVSKVLRFVNEPTATVRHILLSINPGDDKEKVQEKADSIIKVIRSKQNFEEMVTLYSEDIASVDKGGKYEKFIQGMMVAPFNDFSFNKPIGSLGSVETNYGIHIVEVLGREVTRRPILASVVRKVEPSKTTIDNVNGIASNYIFTLDNDFSGKSAEEIEEIFDSLAVNNGYRVAYETIRKDNPRISQGFNDIVESRFLKLAFDDKVKVGNLSSSPIRDRNQVIVAYVAEVIKEETPTFEAVKSNIERSVRREKQAEYLMDNMLNAKDIESLAKDLGVEVKTEGLTFSANSTAIGNEPVLIGVAFSGLADGETSIPVKGNNGVFVLRVDETTYPEEVDDYSAEKGQLESQGRNNIVNQFQNSLMESVDVIDNRNLRKYGIR